MSQQRISELEEALENALGCWTYDGVSDQHETVFLQTTRVLEDADNVEQ